jgi:hypothetical protein
MNAATASTPSPARTLANTKGLRRACARVTHYPNPDEPADPLPGPVVRVHCRPPSVLGTTTRDLERNSALSQLEKSASALRCRPGARVSPLPRQAAEIEYAGARRDLKIKNVWTYRIQGCGAMIRARWASSPLIVHPDRDGRAVVLGVVKV